MEALDAAATVDLRGRSITTFIAHEASSRLAGLEEGEVLRLRLDAYEPIITDLAAWCRMTGHALVDVMRREDETIAVVAKGSPTPHRTRLAVVISTNRLDELISPLGFALAAALEGIHVDCYLQGPAVRILKRGYRPKLRGAARPFSFFAGRDLERAGHIPPQAKLRQLHELGGDIYLCGPSLDRFRVRPDDLVIAGLPVVAYLTFMEVMERADVQLYV